MNSLPQSRIIFLDMDGVLNKLHCLTKELYYLNKDNVKTFVNTIKNVNAKIVISSAWRALGKEGFIEKLKEQNAEELISHLHEDMFCPKLRSYKLRGEEINAWLNNHKDENIKYLIVDDSADFFDDQPHLQIISYLGFTIYDTLFIEQYFYRDNIDDRTYVRDINVCYMNTLKRRLEAVDKWIPLESYK